MEALLLAECAHCGNPISPSQIIYSGKDSYCCHGCKTVRETFLEAGLEDFYKYRNEKLDPVDSLPLNKNFGYLDDVDFQKQKLPTESGLIRAKFYIEGARCQACLWVLESLPERFENVRSARFNLDKLTLTLWCEMGAELSNVMKAISSYGYTSHLLLEDEDIALLRKEEKKKDLRRLGVSFACAGNIMLLSASAYAGLEGELLKLFDRVSLFLCVPTITYGALPFYRSALGGLASGRFSIDVPVALGVLLGFALSCYHVFIGKGDVYFDTVSMLVFLLLGSRYLLEAARERGLEASEVKSFYSNHSAKRVGGANGEVKEVHASLLKKGEKIIIEPGDIAPADSKVFEGVSYFNESVLSGESFPLKKEVGEFVYAGSENQGVRIMAEVVHNASDSKMGQVLSRLQDNWGKQTEIAQLSDRFAKSLVICVSVISVFLFFYFWSQGAAEEGLSRALAVVIITCPCALGFNIPLVMMLSMRKFAKMGIILKDDRVIEKLGRAKKVFMDKTGTITSGGRKIHFEWSGEPEWAALYSLEEKSRHPLARATIDSIKDVKREELEIRNYLEAPGEGPRAEIKDQGGAEAYYKIGPDPFSEAAYALFKNDRIILRAYSSDDVDPLFPETVSKLTDLGKEVFILSGDTKERVYAAKKLANGMIKKVYWRTTPTQKETIISDSKDALMFGDGVNDALALKSAYVGVAASGGVDLALASSEVYLCKGGVETLVKLFTGAMKVMSIVKSNIFIATLYNLFFIFAAVLGHITPLAAAILMPLSSLTLLMLSLFRLRSFEAFLTH